MDVNTSLTPKGISNVKESSKCLSVDKNIRAVFSMVGDNSQRAANESKLARILKPAFGGNCKTIVICTISKSKESYQSTFNILSFGSKLRKIKNFIRANEIPVGSTQQKENLIEMGSEDRGNRFEVIKIAIGNNEEALNSVKSINEELERLRKLNGTLTERNKYLCHQLAGFKLNSTEAIDFFELPKEGNDYKVKYEKLLEEVAELKRSNQVLQRDLNAINEEKIQLEAMKQSMANLEKECSSKMEDIAPIEPDNTLVLKCKEVEEKGKKQNKEIASLSKIVQDQKKTIAQLQKQNKQLADIERSYETNAIAFKKEFTKLQTEKQGIAFKLRNKTNRLQMIEDERNKIKMLLENSKTENTTLKKSLERVNKENQKLIKEFLGSRSCSKNDALKETSTKIEALENKVKEIYSEKKLESVKRNLWSNKNKENHSIINEKILKGHLNKSNHKVIKLNDDKKLLLEECNTIQKRVQVLENEKKEITERNEALSLELHQVEVLANNIRNELNITKAQNNKFSGECLLFKEQLGKSVEEVKRLNKQNEELILELGKTQEYSKNVVEENKVLKIELERTQKYAMSNEETLNEYKEKGNIMQVKYCKLEGQYKICEGTINDQNKKIKELVKKNESLALDLHTKSNTIKSLDKNINEQKAIIMNAKEEKERLMLESNKAKEQIGLLKLELRNLQEEINHKYDEALKEELNKTQAYAQQLELKLTNYKQRIEGIIRTNKQLLANIKEHIVKGLSELQNSIRALDEKYCRFQERFSMMLNDHIMEVKSVKAKGKRQLDESQAYIKTLESKLSDIQLRYKEIEQSNERLLKNIEELKNNQLNSDKTHTEEKNKLKQELDKATTHNNLLDNELNGVKVKMDNMRKEKDKLEDDLRDYIKTLELKLNQINKEPINRDERLEDNYNEALIHINVLEAELELKKVHSNNRLERVNIKLKEQLQIAKDKASGIEEEFKLYKLEIKNLLTQDSNSLHAKLKEAQERIGLLEEELKSSRTLSRKRLYSEESSNEHAKKKSKRKKSDS